MSHIVVPKAGWIKIEIMLNALKKIPHGMSVEKCGVNERSQSCRECQACLGFQPFIKCIIPIFPHNSKDDLDIFINATYITIAHR